MNLQILVNHALNIVGKRQCSKMFLLQRYKWDRGMISLTPSPRPPPIQLTHLDHINLECFPDPSNIIPAKPYKISCLRSNVLLHGIYVLSKKNLAQSSNYTYISNIFSANIFLCMVCVCYKYCKVCK